MEKNICTFLFSVLIVLILPAAAAGQGNKNTSDTLRKGAPRIFIDCESCDMNYARIQIPFVNYVRDVKEAQVFILVTKQDAGSGGEQYTFTYQGQEDFNGMNDTLVYTSNPDETSEVVREKMTNLLKMGLMRYVAKTPVFYQIEIKHNADLQQAEVIDKWNNWVFELSTEPQFQSEEANKLLELRNSVNVSKVTKDIKLQIEVEQFYNREKFIENVNTDSSKTTTYVTNEKFLNNLFVKSLSEHWSTGFLWTLASSTRENYRFRTELLPAIEYDIYPYSESTHRQLRILYGAGLQYNNYYETSIYNEKKEDLYKQFLGIAFRVQKKWGLINISLEGSNYFHDVSKNRIELNTEISLRIFKGLSLRLDGGIAHINDQINLKKGDISEADRLLKLTELATKYRLEGGLEITYTFGSIYNNIVNPRFGD
jgi:hypothetical protein